MAVNINKRKTQCFEFFQKEKETLTFSPLTQSPESSRDKQNGGPCSRTSSMLSVEFPFHRELLNPEFHSIYDWFRFCLLSVTTCAIQAHRRCRRIPQFKVQEVHYSFLSTLSRISLGNQLTFRGFIIQNKWNKNKDTKKNHSGGISAELKYKCLRYGLFFVIYLEVLPPKFAGRM